MSGASKINFGSYNLVPGELTSGSSSLSLYEKIVEMQANMGNSPINSSCKFKEGVWGVHVTSSILSNGPHYVVIPGTKLTKKISSTLIKDRDICVIIEEEHTVINVEDGIKNDRITSRFTLGGNTAMRVTQIHGSYSLMAFIQ